MFCDACGTDNPDTNQFCNNCGKPLVIKQQAPPPPKPAGAPPSPPAPRRPGKISRKLVAIILVIMVIAMVTAATGIVYVPGASEVLGTSKPRDLGVTADPAAFSSLLARENVKFADPADRYFLTANIRYGNAAPMDVTLSSKELTSLMQATNTRGPLTNMQVRLLDNNRMEMSSSVDLTEYGYPVRGPVYLKGTFTKRSSSGIAITLEDGSLGLIPIPDSIRAQAADGLSQAVNRQLSGMPGLRIDELTISNGQLHYRGAFPRTAAAR